MSSDGSADSEISNALSLSPVIVGLWRKRLISCGLDGLKDMPRSGKPPTCDKEATRNNILNALERLPPKGQAIWDGKALASKLGISDDKVWRVLKEKGIHLQRRRTWHVSTDPQFTEKAADRALP